jgi:threonine/homoserine/homoserine lactone efflux protein
MGSTAKATANHYPLSHPEHRGRPDRLNPNVDDRTPLVYPVRQYSMESYFAFIIGSLICTAAPGPDNLAIISLGLAHGRRAGMGFAIGCALGCLTHTIWVTLGVAALVATSDIAFGILKYAGAAYLVFLGVQALRSDGAKISEAKPEASSRFLLRGFIANAINPKVALFFLAFLPQFVSQTGHVSLQMLFLGLSFAVLTLVVFLPLGYFSGRVGGWLRGRPSVARWMDRLTGMLFIGLAIRLALARRIS